MPDAERPPGEAPSRVIPLRSGRRGGRFAPLPSAADVGRRLAALEKQVEEALADAGRASGAADALQTALDEALAAYSQLRRWLMGESTENPIGELSRQLFYHWWWRVDVVGLERLPRRGRLLVVANRSGAMLPYEAFMVAEAVAHSGAAVGRTVHPLVDESLLALPVFGGLLEGLGAEPNDPETLRRHLEADRAVVAFPEGPDAVAKPWGRRYRLASLARGPLFRLAIETGTPIVPVAVIGAEEVHPVLARVEALGRAVGLPALPITPTLVPLPTKWTLLVGEPLDPTERHSAADARNAKVVRAVRDRVRERLQGLVSDGVRRRRGLFV